MRAPDDGVADVLDQGVLPEEQEWGEVGVAPVPVREQRGRWRRWPRGQVSEGGSGSELGSD